MGFAGENSGVSGAILSNIAHGPISCNGNTYNFNGPNMFPAPPAQGVVLLKTTKAYMTRSTEDPLHLYFICDKILLS
ncbi:predicted protein [Arabidopsis lyrata subsp. lyrata]|uniref:Predicted protein n=1 Tax=Arabidopsis lyrata subsp. lyrata TaxID=81972 RepID=D7KBE5_ARALL|nr:predicted protein [Arabidopsis lyrata subsp. lyrata]